MDNTKVIRIFFSNDIFSKFSSFSIGLKSSGFSIKDIVLFLGVIISTTFNSLIVNVPVLSEAIVVQEPNDSTATKFFTITFFLAILFIPIARHTVMAIGKPSGIAATLNPLASIKVSFKLSPIL